MMAFVFPLGRETVFFTEGNCITSKGRYSIHISMYRLSLLTFFSRFCASPQEKFLELVLHL
jgi:hypothetical protein